MIDLISNLGRAGYGLAGMVFFLWWQRSQYNPRWLWPTVWAVTRISAALFLFGLLQLPAPTDATSTYIEQARGALDGRLPYRDFESSFAPLFPWVLGIFTTVWDSAVVFVAAAIAIEALVLVLWMHLGHLVAPREAVTIALAAYLCSALPFNVVMMGQDEIGVAGLLVILLLLLHRSRLMAAAFVSGVMMLVTKFTSLLYLPFLAWRSGRPVLFGIVCGVVAVPVYAFFNYAGADVLTPVKFESGLHTNGNLFFLLSYLDARWMQQPLAANLALLGLMIVLATLFFRYWFRRRPDTPNLAEALVLAQLVFLLLFKKSYHSYLAMVMPLLCLLLAERLPRWLPWLLLLTTLSVVQQSLFFRVMNFADLSAWTWTGASWSERTFVVTDVFMVGGYVWLTIDLLRLPAVAIGAAFTARRLKA